MLDAGTRKLVASAAGPRRAVLQWLRDYGERLDNAARHAVRAGHLSEWAEIDWTGARRVLRRVAGHHPGHCFNVRQHPWLSLTEVQATGGLAHFLDRGPSDARRARIAAMLTACSAERIEASDIIDGRVEAEFPIGDGGRLDLLLTAHVATGRDRVVIVEAKFAHELSPGQLRRYEAAVAAVATDRHLVAPLVTLILLGQRHTVEAKRQMRSRPGWRYLHWHDLVHALEGELGRAGASAGDDEDFRRFRRTLWERCA